MLVRLKKISGVNASLFSIGYEVEGIPVHSCGKEADSFQGMTQLHLKLPATKFTERPFQFSDGEILKITENNVITRTSVWKFTVIS